MSSLATSKFLCGFVGVEGGGGLFVEISIEYSLFHIKGSNCFFEHSRDKTACKL